MIWLVYYWKPLSSFSECLASGDAMPCLLWAAVMWVRSISVSRLSVWLHSSMLPAGRARRNPQYRPEHTPPRGTTEGQFKGPEKEMRRKEKQGRETPAETPKHHNCDLLFEFYSILYESLLWIYFHDSENAWCKALKQNNFKSARINEKFVSGTY